VDAVQAAVGFSDFCDNVGTFWASVRGELTTTVGLWKRKTEEEQRRHLVNKTSPPMDQGRAEELVQEINKLLSISELHALEGGGLVRPLNLGHWPSLRGGGHLCVPGWMPLPWRNGLPLAALLLWLPRSVLPSAGLFSSLCVGVPLLLLSPSLPGRALWRTLPVGTCVRPAAAG
jgi:hypothetical protein